ncbi:MAG: pilus assembly protein PilM [Planctomycetota bacterium]
MAWVERQLLSIDWDVRTLRVVWFTLRPNGGVRIKKVLSAAVPAEVPVGDPAAFGQLLRDVLDREKVTATRMVVDVPRDQAVLNTLKLPAVSLDDLPAMVEFQIAKELPFPLSAAVTDFAAPDTPESSGTQDVLVAAIRHEVLEYYKQTAEVAGLKLERVGLRPYANKVAVNELLGDMRHERVLFVDVGPVLTEIDVLRHGKLAFSRSASVLVPPMSALEPAPAPEKGPTTLDLDLNLAGAPADAVRPEQQRVVQALLRAVTLTMEAYRAGDPGAEMNHVVVGGDTGLEEELLDAIRQRYDLTGERYNPTAYFGWDSASGAAAGGFAAALGLALAHAGEGRLQFDFLCPKKPVTRSRRRLRKVPLATAVAVIFLAAGIVAYQRVIVPQKRQLEALAREIDDRQKELKEYNKFRDMLAAVEKFEREQVIWIDELTDVLSVWPGNDQIVLTQIDLSQKDGIKLQMDCKDRGIPEEARKQVEEFKWSDDGQPRFDAALGAISDQPGQNEYAAKTTMTITLVNRSGRAD